MNYDAFSHQIFDICLRLRQGERVWIDSWDHTVDLASHLAWECRKRGFETLLTLQPENLWLRSVQEGPLEFLDRLTSQQAAALGATNAYIFTLGPRSPVPWERIPVERRGSVTLWFLEQNRFVGEWKRISTGRKVKMLGIEATLATPERARSLGLDFEAWKAIMYAGCMADYNQVAGRGTKLAHVMGGDEKVRITTPQGTDLTFKLDDRPVQVSDGIVTEEKARVGEVVFLPAGDVEVSADEESAEGKVVYDVPVYSRNGPVRSLSIRVVHGRIVEYTASYGSDVFKKHVDSGRDADRFAFFGFGLNPNLRHGFTQDDKVLGGVTVGFGDNEAKGGRNRADQDWWGSMTQATVEINGQVVMKDGNLLG